MMVQIKYQDSGPYGFRQEDFFMFSLYIKLCNPLTPGWGHFWPQEPNFNKLGRGPPGDATYQIPRP